MKDIVRITLAFAITATLGACYYDNADDLYPNGCNTTMVSYSENLIPILEKHQCISCHDAQSEQGGVNLDGYENILVYVENGQLMGSIRHDPGFEGNASGNPEDVELRYLQVPGLGGCGRTKQLRLMKRIILLIVVIGAIGAAIGLYMYNKPTVDASKLDADLTITATNLMTAFSDDESQANAEYLGKVLEVGGVVKETSSNDDGTAVISLESGSMMGAVVCNMSKSSADIKDFPSAGDQVVIKGTCSGYLMDVVLERAVMVY